MKLVHIGFMCALLLSGFELAAKGGFRRIYDEEVDLDTKREKCLRYLVQKESPDDSQALTHERSLRYFLKFAKHRFNVPVAEGDKWSDAASYSQFKSEMCFMMATQNRGWSFRKASQKMGRLGVLLGGLRELRKKQPQADLSPKAIQSIVNDFMAGKITQPKMPQLRVKTSALMAWKIWAKKEFVKGEFREKFESGNAQGGLGYLITKMQSVHRLTAAQGIDWDRYLLLKFMGWHITDPKTLPPEEQSYRAKRAGLIFVSRLAESSFTQDENLERQTRIAQEIAELRGSEMPAHFVEDVLYGMSEQYNSDRAKREQQYADIKTKILGIWSMWVEKKQAQADGDDPFAGIESPPVQRKAQ